MSSDQIPSLPGKKRRQYPRGDVESSIWLVHKQCLRPFLANPPRTRTFWMQAVDPYAIPEGLFSPSLARPCLGNSVIFSWSPSLPGSVDLRFFVIFSRLFNGPPSWFPCSVLLFSFVVRDSPLDEERKALFAQPRLSKVSLSSGADLIENPKEP